MATQNTRKIGNRPTEKQVSKIDTLHDALTVMKPFVKFSVKALQVIAHSLIFIVKNIPKPGDHKDRPEGGKIIKI